MQEAFRSKDKLFEFAFKLGYMRAVRSNWLPSHTNLVNKWSMVDLWQSRNRWLDTPDREIEFPSRFTQRKTDQLTVYVGTWLISLIASSLAHSGKGRPLTARNKRPCTNGRLIRTAIPNASANGSTRLSASRSATE